MTERTAGCGGAPWSRAPIRPAHVRIDEAALMVTNSLKDYGWKQFPVSVALTIRAARRLDADVTAVDGTCSFDKSSVACQPCKPAGHFFQVLWGLREEDDLVANGHHLLIHSVDNVVDGGPGHPKHS